MSRTEIVRVLRQLAASYIRDRRASGELKSRLIALARQPGTEEVERIRGTLERSVRAADERLRALESVIGAVVIAAATTQDVRAKPRPPDRGPVRGGWSPPPGGY